MAEAIGTFFLVLIGPGSAMVNASSSGSLGHVGVALAFAFVVVAMIYALGHLSGAHISGRHRPGCNPVSARRSIMKLLTSLPSCLAS